MSEIQSRRIGFGVALVILGALFLLDNIGLISFDLRYHLFRWQGVLIIIGTFILISDPRKPAGWILISIGGFFLLPLYLNIPWFSFRTYWPILLIIAGFVYIIRQRASDSPAGEMSDGSADFIDDTNVFGGGDVTVTSKNFKGGKVTAVFGGSNYYFDSASLAEGNHVLDVFYMFGGGTFYVPSDWSVKADVTAVFGGFSDKRRTNIENTTDPQKVLHIKGMVLFGGGEIKTA